MGKAIVRSKKKKKIISIKIVGLLRGWERDEPRKEPMGDPLVFVKLCFLCEYPDIHVQHPFSYALSCA